MLEQMGAEWSDLVAFLSIINFTMSKAESIVVLLRGEVFILLNTLS